MSALDFGVRLPVAGPLANKAAIDEATSTVVNLGFSTVWVHDFIVWTRFLDRAHVSCGSVEAVEEADGPPIFYESLTNLAYLAGITSGTNTKLGVAVLCMPYRNPIVAARQVATIDVLSEGRLILGVGVGAPKDRNNRDFEVLGVPRKGRYGRTTDYVRAMQAIWTQERSSYTGEYVSFPEEEFYPKPVQKPHPPIWMGGSGPTTLGMIAEFGSGWLPGLMKPEDFPQKLEDIERLADEKGRSDLDLTVGTEITACIAPTSQEARDIGHRTLMTMTEGFPISEEQAYRAALMGSPEEVIDQIGNFNDVGVTHFELKFIYQNVPQLINQLELFDSQVITKLG